MQIVRKYQLNIWWRIKSCWANCLFDKIEYTLSNDKRVFFGWYEKLNNEKDFVSIEKQVNRHLMNFIYGFYNFQWLITVFFSHKTISNETQNECSKPIKKHLRESKYYTDKSSK
jgi:hypothetical protein